MPIYKLNTIMTITRFFIDVHASYRIVQVVNIALVSLIPNNNYLIIIFKTFTNGSVDGSVDLKMNI